MLLVKRFYLDQPMQKNLKSDGSNIRTLHREAAKKVIFSDPAIKREGGKDLTTEKRNF